MCKVWLNWIYRTVFVSVPASVCGAVFCVSVSVWGVDWCVRVCVATVSVWSACRLGVT